MVIIQAWQQQATPGVNHLMIGISLDSASGLTERRDFAVPDLHICQACGPVAGENFGMLENQRGCFSV